MVKPQLLEQAGFGQWVGACTDYAGSRLCACSKAAHIMPDMHDIIGRSTQKRGMHTALLCAEHASRSKESDWSKARA